MGQARGIHPVGFERNHLGLRRDSLERQRRLAGIGADVDEQAIVADGKRTEHFEILLMGHFFGPLPIEFRHCIGHVWFHCACSRDDASTDGDGCPHYATGRHLV